MKTLSKCYSWHKPLNDICWKFCDFFTKEYMLKCHEYEFFKAATY